MVKRPLDEVTESYISALSETAPRTTVASHETVIRRLNAHLHEMGVSSSPPEIQEVAEFIRTEFNSSTTATVNGVLDVIANFLAYVGIDTPARVKSQLCTALDELETDRRDTDWSPAAFQSDLTSSVKVSVAVFRDALRQQQYGTRLHAFVELMIATGSRAIGIRELDRDDLDLENESVSLSAPKTSAVGAHDLGPPISKSLPSNVVEILTTYLNHERYQHSGHTSEPLFTTPCGRISASTLRRSIKKTSHAVLVAPQHPEESGVPERFNEHNELQALTLHDIRQYTLTQLTDY